MIVKAQIKGCEITGLHIGVRNVRRYFPRAIRVIELELDHLRIQCGLSPQFWNGEPEIRDPRLCGWLGAKVVHQLGAAKEVRLAMTPEGNNMFRLRSSPVKSEHGERMGFLRAG